MFDDLKKHVESMIDKAANAATSEDALRFSQAALNAANAILCLSSEEAKIDRKV